VPWCLPFYPCVAHISSLLSFHNQFVVGKTSNIFPHDRR
jgi:hypothetical protein